MSDSTPKPDVPRGDLIGQAERAIERLADQAWHTAGDDEGRERVHQDRAAALRGLGSMSPQDIKADAIATARAEERARLTAALNAVMRWRIPHPSPAVDGFDYMLLLIDVEAALKAADQ